MSIYDNLGRTEWCEITFAVGGEYVFYNSLTYDANVNITQIADGSGTVQYRYEYDNLGQLKREDNRPQNKTFVYTYDNAGNRILYGR